jgi:phospholipid/cholesterol/gamma-HCH transport system substrate-binding protein
MIKQAPTAGRIFAMVAFSLSCFGIVLFLWLQFGGPVPLKAEGYRVKVAFPEAVGLAEDVDVRSAGISIGTVRKLEVEEESHRALATLVLEPEFAPLASDARAILRRKTLLGETFVELTPGSRDAPPVPDGGRLRDSAVGETVELDEVLQTFDPRTRRSFQLWQQELARAVDGRGEDLNNVVGHLPEFAENGTNLLFVLNEQEAAVRGLVRDTGEVYSALSQDEEQLANLIRGSHGVFRQTAAERVSLAEAFGIFPTFLSESKATLERLERFSRDTRPLVRDLRPVARELRPTLAAVRAFAPDLDRFFTGFGRQIRVSDRALPALRETLDEARPFLGAVGPFLSELNPIISWLELHQHLVADFLGYGGSATADTTDSAPAGETGHYLRQLGLQGLESIAIHRNRLSTNRGNAYLPPIFTGRETARRLSQPNWDCVPSGGEMDPRPSSAPGGAGAQPGCWIAPRTFFQGRQQGAFPHVERDDYRR